MVRILNTQSAFISHTASVPDIKPEFINTNLAKNKEVLFLEVSAMAKVTLHYGFPQVCFVFQFKIAISFIMQARIFLRINRA